MKIFVTGGSGFVGAETIKLLEKKGDTTINYDLMLSFDIRDAEQLMGVVRSEKPDRVLHLAAVARFADADRDPRLAFETNVVGTANVAAVAAKAHVPLVYASTGSVYMPIKETPPITEEFSAKGNSVYACGKYIGELYVKQNSPHMILRYAHLYGPEKRMHGLIGGFLDRINHGMAPVLYGGKQSNDFTYIKDVARANYLALHAPWDKWNQIYNIGTGEELTAREAGEVICETTGWMGGIESGAQRVVDPDRFVFDTTKARVMLGFEAEYKFREGLTDMFKETALKMEKNPLDINYHKD